MLRSILRDLGNFGTLLCIVLGGHVISILVLCIRIPSAVQHTIAISHKIVQRPLSMARQLKKNKNFDNYTHTAQQLPTASTQTQQVHQQAKKPSPRQRQQQQKEKKGIKKSPAGDTTKKKKAVTPARQKSSEPIVKTAPPPKIQEKTILSTADKPDEKIAIPVESTFNTENVNAQAQYDEVYRAVTRVWQPPRGIRVKKSAAVRVILDARGIVIQTEVIESSGVIAFDVAARRASKSATYPRSVWNSTTVIHFV